jgi:hypothetical protein
MIWPFGDNVSATAYLKMSDDAEEFSVYQVGCFGLSCVWRFSYFGKDSRSTLWGIESAVASQKHKTPAFGP